MNAINFRKKRERRPPYMRMREIAYDLAEKAVRISKEASYKDTLSLAAAHSGLALGIRRPDESRIAWAHKVWAEIEDTTAQLTRPQIYCEREPSAGRLSTDSRDPDAGLSHRRTGSRGDSQ